MSRKSRVVAREQNTKEVLEHAERAGWNVRELNEYQYRFNGFVDYYPTSRRAGDLRTGQWFDIVRMSQLEDIMNDPRFL